MRRSMSDEGAQLSRLVLEQTQLAARGGKSCFSLCLRGLELLRVGSLGVGELSLELLSGRFGLLLTLFRLRFDLLEQSRRMSLRLGAQRGSLLLSLRHDRLARTCGGEQCLADRTLIVRGLQALELVAQLGLLTRGASSIPRTA